MNKQTLSIYHVSKLEIQMWTNQNKAIVERGHLMTISDNHILG